MSYHDWWSLRFVIRLKTVENIQKPQKQPYLVLYEYQLKMNPYHHNYDLQLDDYEKKYFGHEYSSLKTQSNPDHDEYRKDILRQQIQRLNHNLDALSIPKIGDQFSCSVEQIEKTLATYNISFQPNFQFVDRLQSFLSLRQKQLDFRNQTYSKTKKLQNEVESTRTLNQKLSQDKKRLESDKESLTKKIKFLQQTIKENNEKAFQDKEQLSKQVSRLISQENQYKNQIKKRDNAIKEKNDEILRIQKSGKGITYRNSFDVLGNLEQNAPFLYYVNAEHEFGQMVQRNMEETYEKLANENKYYRDCLANLTRELTDILELRKGMLMGKKGLYDDSEDNRDGFQGLNLNSFKLELLNLPFENSKEAVDLIEENVNKFRENMDKMDILGERHQNENPDGDKLKAVKNVKALIKSYRQIVQSQEQLINKVVAKAKDLRPTQPSIKSGVMDEEEIEKAKRFLETHKSYIETKNKEIEITKKAMANSIKRVEEERGQMTRRKRQIEEETAKLRKQIELIPTHFDSL